MDMSDCNTSLKRYRKWACRLGAGTIAAGASSMATAGTVSGILSYAPLAASGSAATPIPTMGGIGLVMLSVFLLLVFWRMHRSGTLQGGARFLVLALASGTLISGVAGAKLISKAVAAVELTGMFLDMDDEQGGTLMFGGQTDRACVRNVTNVPLRITAMTNLQGQGVKVVEMSECLGDSEAPPAIGGCSVNQVLQPEDVCGIAMSNLPPT